MKTILLDLDGTLLHMDQEKFVKSYFGSVGLKFSKNFDSNRVMNGLIEGTKAMVANDGSLSNEEMFWKVFEDVSNYSKLETQELLEDFYLNDFENSKITTSSTPHAKELINVLKNKGYDLILATNPLFPSIATEKRIQWAGLSIDDFKEVTTYENYHFCKPNPLYFKEILDKFNLNIEDCLMIGNDIDEDMAAKQIGLEVLVVTDNLINRSNKEFESSFIGSLEELVKYIELKV